jgi:DNA polymerase-3 subunit gamma/tau
MAVLYRKYRPQTFADVVGQQAIVQTLRNAVLAGTPAHAYLFTGSRGVGKTSVARIFARAVNCLDLKKNGEPCLKCDICRQMTDGHFLDLVEIDAASNTGVDNIRDLIEHVRFSPSQGKYKVFIIDEVHMLSKGAFNALLKTLEEPPAHAIFILATTEIHKVPLTIISRTQRFDFQRLSRAEIVGALAAIAKREKLKFPAEVLDLVAVQADGSLRDALSLLDKLAAAGEKIDQAEAERILGVTSFAASAELLDAISSGDATGIPALFERYTESGTDFIILNKNFLEYLRKVLVVGVGGKLDAIGLAAHEMDRVKAHAAALNASQIMFVIRLFLRSLKDAGTAPSADLPLLVSAIEAAYKCAEMKAGGNKAPRAESVRSEPARPRPAVSPAPPIVDDGSNGPTVQVSEQEVLGQWSAILDRIKKINSPLATLVRNSPMVGVANGVIMLEVRYLFHKEHLESAKNRSVISDALYEVMGKRLGLAARVAKLEPPADPGLQATALGDALRVFGGELVE